MRGLDGGVAQETAANDGPRADEEVEGARSLAVWRKLGERVLARLGSDWLAAQLYERAMKEDLDPAEEATRLNRAPAEIKAAHLRLRLPRPCRSRRVERERGATDEGSPRPG